MDQNLRIAFEHDFVRLEQQTRAIHVFFQAGNFDAAVEWLDEVINVARGLRLALTPCEHSWILDQDNQPYCTKHCNEVQLR